ncbi:MAG: PH domain-containing protein [Candidatus Hermodarchaeota archaeon]|nr:PH domain-containing protein [Candidatus Hermodarchaeota archaeon]
MSQPAVDSQSSGFCPSCHINMAERYCRECGQVFCLPCSRQDLSEFFTCPRCGPDNIEDQEDEVICTECEEPAQRATRRVYLCPNCGSEEIIPIHNMRQDLVGRFRTTYYRLRTGHELLSGFAARLRILRWRVRELRTASFLHDPEVEKELLELMKSELPSVQERTLFRARNVVERHRASKYRFMNPERWTITEFPLLAGLIDAIQEDVSDYQAYCRDLVNGLDVKLATIEARLTQVAEWHKIFNDHIEYLPVLENERPVAALQPVNLNKTETSEGMGNGILFVTTQRLIFLGRKGFFTKETRVVHTIPLGKISGVTLQGRIRRRVHIEIDEEEFKIGGASKVLEAIPDAITLASSFNEHSLVTTSGSLRVLNLKVDVSSLRDELDTLINYAVSPEEMDETGAPDGSRPYPYPDGYYPYYSRTRGAHSDELERDPLFQLEQQKFSIESTIELLKRQSKEGKLSDENFYKQYRSLTEELFLIEAKIEDLRIRRRYDERYRDQHR